MRFPAVHEYIFYLNNIVRDLRDWFGDTARLERRPRPSHGCD